MSALTDRITREYRIGSIGGNGKNQDIVRMYMPDLARALDRLTKGTER